MADRRRIWIHNTASYLAAASLHEGVLRYARRTWQWALSGGDSGADGLLLFGPDADWALGIARQQGAPAVGVQVELDSAPSVVTDDRAVGEAAAEHLIGRGLRDLAFFGFTGESWSRQREEGFRSRAALHEGAHMHRSLHHPVETWMDDASRRDARDWLSGLPKPAGILACNDITALHLEHECAELGLGIPDPVALLGVNNQTSFCESAPVPLTSVDLDLEQIGYTAAALLDRLMAGERVEPSVRRLPPGGVVERLSTGADAFEDPEVARAVEYMRAHAQEGISVAHVMEQVHVSRSTLETRFRQALGHSPAEEIRRARLRRARELVAGTDLPLTQVAFDAGFANQSWFSKAFKAEFGQSPSRYRASRRLGGSSPS